MGLVAVAGRCAAGGGVGGGPKGRTGTEAPGGGGGRLGPAGDAPFTRTGPALPPTAARRTVTKVMGVRFRRRRGRARRRAPMTRHRARGLAGGPRGGSPREAPPNRHRRNEANRAARRATGGAGGWELWMENSRGGAHVVLHHGRGRGGTARQGKCPPVAGLDSSNPGACACKTKKKMLVFFGVIVPKLQVKGGSPPSRISPRTTLATPFLPPASLVPTR